MRYWILLMLVALVACGDPPTQAATINGFDSASGTIISPINLWRDYTDRSKGIAATVRHGERVSLLRESGGGALVQKSDGTQGWLNSAFIRP